ncbi:tetratricopeptide repeat protein [Pseudanabaena mucicola]|uniref:Tetratricopeptide repeat protein n=1 Tax=Pseudanabaena mucicola FACHB-723 TaxID=2692860 RepID=A0ABR7ZX34_9CYAN|nr:tetratricopeptide repeat protein [Pseudanabaena mucicola]MBD2188335.1 tetratricopeptide repeat protein [Pseudanabaena mucicola FACHB-723]
MRSIIAALLTLCLMFYTAPAQAQLNITEAESNQLDALVKKAFEATDAGEFPQAESYWTELIKLYPDNAAGWSNRGNSKMSQNLPQQALADYNKSVELAPNFPDPYLNRGAALESLGKWEAAIADYNRVLEIDPNDAAAYNNRGNAKAGLGKWEEAIADYQKAMQVNSRFSTAFGNNAIALYELGSQTGDTSAAIKAMKNILRKYPNFTDVRAALTAALWADKKLGEAESNWVSVENLDPRYRDINWVKNIRRWPPSLVTALEKFLTLK